ncbi:MAG TPA: hypothetical protein VGK29_27215 [Paludibaculum sp.]|jgi:hypothetical protein
MLRPWLQLAITSLVALSLVAAPCKNCQPKQQSQPTAPAHDCCPKPQPQKSESCSWQPAAYDAVEAQADIAIDVTAIVAVTATIELHLAGPLPVTIQALPFSPSPPTLTALRI